MRTGNTRTSEQLLSDARTRITGRTKFIITAVVVIDLLTVLRILYETREFGPSQVVMIDGVVLGALEDIEVVACEEVDEAGEVAERLLVRLVEAGELAELAHEANS